MYKWKALTVSKILSKKGGGSDFFHKKREIHSKNRGIVLKREGGGGGNLSLIFILTKPFQYYLSLSEWW